MTETAETTAASPEAPATEEKKDEPKKLPGPCPLCGVGALLECMMEAEPKHSAPAVHLFECFDCCTVISVDGGPAVQVKPCDVAGLSNPWIAYYLGLSSEKRAASRFAERLQRGMRAFEAAFSKQSGGGEEGAQMMFLERSHAGALAFIETLKAGSLEALRATAGHIDALSLILGERDVRDSTKRPDGKPWLSMVPLPGRIEGEDETDAHIRHTRMLAVKAGAWAVAHVTSGLSDEGVECVALLLEHEHFGVGTWYGTVVQDEKGGKSVSEWKHQPPDSDDLDTEPLFLPSKAVRLGIDALVAQLVSTARQRGGSGAAEISASMMAKHPAGPLIAERVKEALAQP